MSSWPSAKARRVFAALKRIGWRHDRTVGSHKIMKRTGWADYPFSFHDSWELGPAVLAKNLKKDRPSTPRPMMAPPPPTQRARNARRQGFMNSSHGIRRHILIVMRLR